MKTSLSIAVSCLALCSACAGTAPIEGPPQTVSRSAAFPTTNLRGYQPLTVRTYAGSQATSTEIEKVECQLKGQGYQVAFSSPARLAVPVYGKKTPLPTVTCHYTGQTVSKKPKLTNETEGDMFRGMIVGTGILGPKAVLAAGVIAAGVVAVRPGKESDEYGFKMLHIVFSKTSTTD